MLDTLSDDDYVNVARVSVHEASQFMLSLSQHLFFNGPINEDFSHLNVSLPMI